MSALWLVLSTAGCLAGAGLFAVGCWAIADSRRHRDDPSGGLLGETGDPDDTDELPRCQHTRRHRTGTVHPPVSRRSRLRNALTGRTGWYPTTRSDSEGDDRG